MHKTYISINTNKHNNNDLSQFRTCKERNIYSIKFEIEKATKPIKMSDERTETVGSRYKESSLYSIPDQQQKNFK